MKYDVERLVREVRVMMDENADGGLLAESGDVDTLGLDDLIEAQLPDVLKAVLLAAPAEDLGSGVQFEDTDLVWESGHEGLGMASMLLPEDFLRVVFVQMSDWLKGVSTTIGVDNPLYDLQRSRYGAGRGTPERPVAAVVRQSFGLTLEMYTSITPGARLKRGRYVRIPEIEDGKLEVPMRLRRTLVRATADAVLGVLNPQLRAASGEESE